MEKVQLNSIIKEQNGLEQSKNKVSSTFPRAVGINGKMGPTTEHGTHVPELK